MLKQYKEHIHNKFNGYAFGFFCCELLHPCISILSVYLTHKFLQHEYLYYGVDVYKYVLLTFSKYFHALPCWQFAIIISSGQIALNNNEPISQQVLQCGTRGTSSSKNGRPILRTFPQNGRLQFQPVWHGWS